MDRIPFPIEDSFLENPPRIFGDIKYCVVGTVDEKITKLLDNGNAKQLGYTTHVIVGVGGDEVKIAEAEEIYGIPLVQPLWVVLSAKAGKLLPTHGFEGQPNRLFSTVTVCSSGIRGKELGTLWANVTYYGGNFLRNLTEKGTHLVINTFDDGNGKYQTAKKHGIKVVCSDWVTDCIKANSLLEETQYDPQYIIKAEPVRNPLPQVQEGKISQISAETVVSNASSKLVTAVPSLHRQLKVTQASVAEAPPRPQVSPPQAIIHEQPKLQQFQYQGEQTQSSNSTIIHSSVTQQGIFHQQQPYPQVATVQQVRTSSIQMYHSMTNTAPSVPILPPQQGQQGHSVHMSWPPGLPRDQVGQGITLQQKASIPVVHPSTQQIDIYRQIQMDPNTKANWAKMDQEQRSLLIKKLALRSRERQLRQEMMVLQQQLDQQSKARGQRQQIPQQVSSPGDVQQVGPQQHIQGQTILVQQQFLTPHKSTIPCSENPMPVPQCRPALVSQRTPSHLAQSTSPPLVQGGEGGQLPGSLVIPTDPGHQMLPQNDLVPSQQQQKQKLLKSPQLPSPTTQKFPPRSPVQSVQTHSLTQQHQPDQPQKKAILKSEGPQQSPGRPPSGTPGKQTERVLSPTQTSPFPPRMPSRPHSPVGCVPSGGSGTLNQPSSSSSVTISPSGTPFSGFEPNFEAAHNGFLLGCVFWMAQSTDTAVAHWKGYILRHGGEVVPEYNPWWVTHGICNKQQFPAFQHVLRDGKRLVTLHWLSDTILKKVMAPPFYATHLPPPFSENDEPLKGQSYSVTGFDGEDRGRVIRMLRLLGANYTPYFTKINKGLVACRSEGKKYRTAVEFKLPVVNIQYLNELWLRDLSCLQLVHSGHPKYQHFSMEQPFCFDINIAPHLMGMSM